MSQMEDKKRKSLPAEPPRIVTNKGANDFQADAGETMGSGSVEKIRDILFGAQMRDYEKKFAELKERMREEIAHLREESLKRFEMLEGFIKNEVESLSERLGKEQNERSDAIKEVLQNHTGTTTALEKKISQLDEQLTKNTRDLRQQLMEQSQSLSEDIRKKRDDASASLERVAKELQNTKVNRADLSEILVGMAMRLADEAEPKAAIETDAMGNE
jgi:DNA repair exonuclease SbcCD ATPase subunit